MTKYKLLMMQDHKKTTGYTVYTVSELLYHSLMTKLSTPPFFKFCKKNL